jgi:phosphohistidine phosphatase
VNRLYLLRHAKSSWDDPGLADQDRPLAPRGRRATKLVAKHLRRERIAPAVVLCSPARRTRETFEGIAAALGGDVSVRVEPELYGASDRDLLERLREIPDTVQSVMLIGHNPAIQALALSLAGSGGQLASLERKYPTGALATLTFWGSWRELETAELVGFVRPRDLTHAS